MAKPTTLRKHDSARRPAGCGYCHEKISGPTHLCWDCNAPMHKDCFGALGHCATLGCVNNASLKTSAPSPVLAQIDKKYDNEYDNEMDADDDADEVSFRVAPKRVIDKVDRISAPIKVAWALTTTAIAWTITLGVVLFSLGIILYVVSKEGLMRAIVPTLVILAVDAIFILASHAMTRWAGLTVKELKN